MPITVPHTELHGSGGAGLDRNGGFAARRFKCAWAQADQLCQELRGLNYSPPAQHPRYPYLYCTRARYDGIGASYTDSQGLAAYNLAAVEATYEPLEFTQGGGETELTTYMREERSPAPQYMTRNGQVNWDEGPNSGGEIKEGKPAFIVPFTNYTLTVFRWWGAPVSSGIFETSQGKVNAGPFRALWTTWPEKTLMFNGATSSRDFTSQGFTAFTVTLSFTFNPRAWNKLRHPNGNYYAFTTGAGSNDPYDYINFTQLLPF